MIKINLKMFKKMTKNEILDFLVIKIFIFIYLLYFNNLTCQAVLTKKYNQNAKITMEV